MLPELYIVLKTTKDTLPFGQVELLFLDQISCPEIFKKFSVVPLTYPIHPKIDSIQSMIR